MFNKHWIYKTNKTDLVLWTIINKQTKIADFLKCHEGNKFDFVIKNIWAEKLQCIGWPRKASLRTAFMRKIKDPGKA